MTQHPPTPSVPRALALAAGLLLVGAPLLPLNLQAQERGEGPIAAAVDAIAFREIGPALMGGRVAALDVHPSSPESWVVGFATGGVWKTETHGMSWTPLFDDQRIASIGALTIAPSNPKVIWVGTGEPQNRQSSPYGAGVFRSIDGGKSWTDLGLEETHHIGRIVVHPDDPDVAWVAAVGHLWGPNPERGVYRTTDGGESWEKVLFIDDDTGAIDIVMDPGDPKTLFAATYQRRRTAYGFSASGSGSGLWRTLDGGESWERLENGLPEGDLGRIGIDVYARDGDLVYALIEGSSREARGLYRSRDRGDSWERVSGNNPRPMYFSLVRIDPNNPDRIYVGGVVMQVSDDGGSTWWEQDGYWEVHVDNHALWIDPNDSDHLVLGNDGGVASSWDGARTWQHHDNLAVGQFYEIGLDVRDPYYVCGGLQDNSSWCGPSQSLTTYGISNRDWYDVWGGDGFYNVIDPTDPKWVFTESQGGNLGRYNVETGESVRIRAVDRLAELEEREEAYDFNWNAPIVVSQHVEGRIYHGADRVLRSDDRGQSWVEASGDLTRGIDRDTLEIFGRPLEEPHLSRNDGISNYGTITTLDESPRSPDIVWAGTDDGNVQVTRDGGTTWTNVVENVPDLPGRRYVSRIEASAHADGRAYLAFDGHRDDDLAPYLYLTEDFGESWTPITDGLPDHSINVVREHHRAPGLLFVGNEVGVWVSVDRGGSWHRMTGGGFPTVPVDDIQIHPRENDLVLGTHGRSIWIADDIAPLEELSEEIVSRPAHLFPVRRATFWSRSGGWPFWGDMWFGENPPIGAMIRYHLADEVDAESVALVVRDAAGEEVRVLEGPTAAGMNEVVWDLEHGPAFEPDEGERAPGGPPVMPGRYTVELEAAGVIDTEEFEVRLDPRIEASPAGLAARQELLMAAHRIAVPIRDADRALESAVEALEEAWEYLEDHPDATEELEARVDSVLERLDDAGDRLNEIARDARAGAGGAEDHWGEPTDDQRWLVDRAWERLPEAIREVNTLVTVVVPDTMEALRDLGVPAFTGEPVPVPTRGGGEDEL